MIYSLRRREERLRGSVVSPGGPVVIPHNSLTLHPNRFDGDDFSSYADMDAVLAAYAAKFPDYNDMDDPPVLNTLDTVNTFGGHQTLRLTPEHPYSDNQCHKAAPVPMNRMWQRYMNFIPSDFSEGADANMNFRIGEAFSATPASSAAGGGLSYYPNYDGAVFYTAIGNSVQVDFSEIKGAFYSWIFCADIDAETYRHRSFFDGNLLVESPDNYESDPTQPTLTHYSFMQSVQWVTSGAGNYMSTGLWEVINGDEYPDPYGLLGE